jgi:hypothetical protein
MNLIFEKRDHANGNPELLELLKGNTVNVYGGDDRIPSMTHKVNHNYIIQVNLVLNLLLGLKRDIFFYVQVW